MDVKENTKGEEWFRLREISKDIWMISDCGESNLYLIKGSKRALLIDTGWGVGNLKEVIKKMTDLPLTVVLTHGHPDHVAGAYLFEEVALSKEDIVLLRERRERYFGGYQMVAEKIAEKQDYASSFNVEEWFTAEVEKINYIEDGDIIDLGGREIEVIKVPGHTPGSIALLDKKERLLFTGDSVAKGHIWLHLEESLPIEVYLNSLKRLYERETEFDYLAPGYIDSPVSKEVLTQLIEIAEGIEKGTKEGRPHHTFVKDAFIYRGNKVAIVYEK